MTLVLSGRSTFRSKLNSIGGPPRSSDARFAAIAPASGHGSRRSPSNSLPQRPRLRPPDLAVANPRLPRRSPASTRSAPADLVPVLGPLRALYCRHVDGGARARRECAHQPANFSRPHTTFFDDDCRSAWGS